MFFFGNNEWDRGVRYWTPRTLWAARPSQHWSGVLWSREQQQVRAEIGRRLREHYEVGSSTIPDRLAQLIEKIERSEFRSERLHDGVIIDERARRVSD
jgi:hypothetical protein